MLVLARKISTTKILFPRIHLLVTKNLNPFLPDRKLSDKNKHEMIYMLWKECMPNKFYQHICKEKKFLYLNGKNVLQPKVSEIVSESLKDVRTKK